MSQGEAQKMRANFYHAWKSSFSWYNLLRDFIFTIIYRFSLENDEICVGDMGCGDGYYTTYFHQEISKNNLMEL